MGFTTRSGKRVATSLVAAASSAKKPKNAANAKPTELLRLPVDCIEAVMVCRPSKRNRSPYVADIFCPSLDRAAICHLPNLDMGGKCVVGAKLWVKPQKDKKGELIGPDAKSPKYGTPKCEFSCQLLLVDESGLDSRYLPTWVGANPNLGEAIAEKLINNHIEGKQSIPGMERAESVARQVTIGNSRVDFLLQPAEKGGKPRIVEVKTVVDSDYCAQWKLPDRKKCVFTRDEPYQRAGIFPWGEQKQKGPDGEKVVSARAIKHVCELTRLVDDGDSDATILFIVIRGDTESFRPNHEACPSFCKHLKIASDKGVQILAKRVAWGVGDDMGTCFDDSFLPVELVEHS